MLERSEGPVSVFWRRRGPPLSAQDSCERSGVLRNSGDGQRRGRRDPRNLVEEGSVTQVPTVHLVGDTRHGRSIGKRGN